MAENFVGEIRTFAFDRVPPGWAPCHGQLLPIAEFETLFALIGTTYGGDGRSTFALPNLQGQLVVAAAAPERSLDGDGAGLFAEAPPAPPSRRPADDPLGTVLAPSRRLHARPGLPASNGDGRHVADRRRRPHRYVALNVCIALFGAFPATI